MNEITIIYKRLQVPIEIQLKCWSASHKSTQSMMRSGSDHSLSSLVFSFSRASIRRPTKFRVNFCCFDSFLPISMASFGNSALVLVSIWRHLVLSPSGFVVHQSRSDEGHLHKALTSENSLMQCLMLSIFQGIRQQLV